MLTAMRKTKTCIPVITFSKLWAAEQPDSATVDQQSPRQGRSCHPCIGRGQPSTRQFPASLYNSVQ